MSSSPSTRRNRSNDVSHRKSRHDDRDNHLNDRDDSEFNTRGHGPPKIEGMVSLKVDNITQRTGVNLLKKVFSKFGDLGDIYVPRYPDTFASRGFAFVRYYRKRDAEEAMRSMNGERLDGRILSIQMARYARPNSKRNGTSRSYRRSGYSDRSRRRRSRSRSRSRSRDRRKSDGRHRRSRSRSAGRSKRRTRYRSKSKSKSKSKSRSRSPSRSRSRSKSRNRSRSASAEKKSQEECENSHNSDVDKKVNDNENNKSDRESEKSGSPNREVLDDKSQSNGR